MRYNLAHESTPSGSQLLRQKLQGCFRALFGSILPLFVFAHFTHHVITAIAAPLLPLIRTSFSLSYTQSGVLLSAFTIAYGLGHLPAGRLSDRFDFRYSFALIALILLVLTVICGAILAGLRQEGRSREGYPGPTAAEGTPTGR